MWGSGTCPGLGGAGFYGAGLGLILTIAFWALIIWAIITVVRLAREGRFTQQGGDGAMNILKERYAKGELTKEQFEQMKKELAEK